jgi:enamine deaminase RidA (YjgF/YER057c/UK114 family)
MRKTVGSGAVWEDIVGYSRAVRIDNFIEVAGTTAVDENGHIIGVNDAYIQTNYILHKIENAILKLGGTRRDIIRTRIYTTDINLWEDIGRAHNEFFRDIKPALTMLEVSALIKPEMLVEIEITAFIDSDA